MHLLRRIRNDTKHDNDMKCTSMEIDDHEDQKSGGGCDEVEVNEE